MANKKVMTNAERQKLWRENRKKLVEIRKHVHPEDADRVHAYIERLNKKRGI